MKTVRDVLLSGQEFLSKFSGFTPAQARRELEDLLAQLLGCKRLDVYLKFERPLSDNELEMMRDWLKRRSQHEPLQWILGEVDFLGNIFPVKEGIFIPRPETEEWVDWITKLPAELFPDNEPPERLLEIGVGSGVICCSLMNCWQNSTGVGIDCSELAIDATSVVAKKLGIDERLTLHHLRAGKFRLPSNEEPFDFIVSNPPYVPLSDKPSLSKEVLHDPPEALFAGDDGLDAFRTFTKKLPDWGRSGTAFAFEIGIGQVEGVRKLLEPLSCELAFRNDLNGIPRLVWGHLK